MQRLVSSTKDNTTGILRAGFAAIILLLLIVASYSLYRVDQLTGLLINIVEINDKKIELVNQLHDTVNNRWISLRKMVATDDPFERDKVLQHFYTTVLPFQQAREKLLALPLTAKERQIMQLLNTTSQQAQPKIRTFVDQLATLGRPPESPSLVDIKELQDQVINVTDSLVKLIKSEALQAVESMRMELRRTYLITALLTLSIIILAITIARIVSHYVNKKNRELMNAMQVKSRFLANMSHEVRTPLTAIIGFAEHLLTPNLTATEQGAAVDTIIRSGHHLQTIVDEILDLSKDEASGLVAHHAEVWLLELIVDVEDTFRQQAYKNGLSFEVNYQPPLPKRITTDPVKLKQILFNLCNNAIKFTERGSIRLNIHCDIGQQQIFFEVDDDGIGISQQELEHIFQPFVQVDTSTTRKFGGTGLGLHLSQRFAELLDGSLTARSEYGKGSCFSLSLPTGYISPEDIVTDFNQPHPQTIRQSVFAEYRRLQGKGLLAEDTQDDQLLIRALLKHTDIHLTAVENGQQAIAAVTQGKFDLVLMDIQMPVMNGLQATQQLREKGWSGAILALTANVLQEDCQRYLQNGFNDVIGKPLNRSLLLEKISSYLPTEHEDNSTFIYSSLLDEDPDFLPAIEHFVQNATEESLQLTKSLKDNNWTEVQQQLHRLKGSGGGIGFPLVTELAITCEEYINDRNYIAAESHIHQLVDVLQRVRTSRQSIKE